MRTKLCERHATFRDVVAEAERKQSSSTTCSNVESACVFASEFASRPSKMDYLSLDTINITSSSSSSNDKSTVAADDNEDVSETVA